MDLHKLQSSFYISLQNILKLWQTAEKYCQSILRSVSKIKHSKDVIYKMIMKFEKDKKIVYRYLKNLKNLKNIRRKTDLHWKMQFVLDKFIICLCSHLQIAITTRSCKESDLLRLIRKPNQIKDLKSIFFFRSDWILIIRLLLLSIWRE